MPLPTYQQVHVDALLTQISIAFFQNPANFTASSLLPVIPVSKRSDIYMKFDRHYFNRDGAQKRAPGAIPANIGYSVDMTSTYLCNNWALEHSIPDETRANADNPLNLERAATLLLAQQMMIKKEVLFAETFLGTGTYGANEVAGASSAGTGEVVYWDDSNSNPIQNVINACTEVQENTGFRPNVLYLSRDVFDGLQYNDDLMDRVKYGQTSPGAAVVTKQALAAVFGVDRIEIGAAIKSTTKEGQASQTSQFITAKKALLAYVPPAPGIEIPTLGYTFAWNAFGGQNAEGVYMSRIRDDRAHADHLQSHMFIDMKLVSNELGYLFNDIIR